jgi:receptor expression-enhancing protein 5/6
MGLLVLMLRSYLVFQNVYVTYKTLKMPPPSSRNGGKPSIRAMSQRKRDMKGCMTIWIVWCCLAAYEAVIEPIVGIFIPFYGEIKSLVLIAFILARARGAEPIYLHAIRPLVKPYMSTVDAVLDVLHNLGDFVFLLVSIPFAPLFAWLRQRYPAGKSEEHPADHDAPPPYSVSSATSLNLPQEGVAADPARSAQLNAAMSKFYAVPPSAPQPEHQFWQPPPFAVA